MHNLLGVVAMVAGNTTKFSDTLILLFHIVPSQYHLFVVIIKNVIFIYLCIDYAYTKRVDIGNKFVFPLKVVLSVIIDYLEENNYDSLIDRLIVGCLTPSS